MDDHVHGIRNFYLGYAGGDKSTDQEVPKHAAVQESETYLADFRRLGSEAAGSLDNKVLNAIRSLGDVRVPTF